MGLEVSGVSFLSQWVTTLNHPSHGWPWLRGMIPMEFWGISIFRKYVYDCYDCIWFIYDCTIYIYSHPEKNEKKTKKQSKGTHWLLWCSIHGAFGIDFTYNKVFLKMGGGAQIKRNRSCYIGWSHTAMVNGLLCVGKIPETIGFPIKYGYMVFSCKCSLKPIHWYGCLLKTLQRFLISQACNLWRWLSDAVAKSGARRMGQTPQEWRDPMRNHGIFGYLLPICSMDGIFTYKTGWVIFRADVGKYSSTMERRKGLRYDWKEITL